MKKALAIFGAIAIAAAIIAGIVIFVKKYTVNFSITKNKPAELPEEDDSFDFDEDINWEEVPVEDDEEDIFAESKNELSKLDGADEF